MKRIERGYVCFFWEYLHLPEVCRAADEGIFFATSALEPTNEAYAIAKICGLKLASFIVDNTESVITPPCRQICRAGDNYHPENAHVLPALIRRF